jgi:hypothetical protein
MAKSGFTFQRLGIGVPDLLELHLIILQPEVPNL